MNFKNYYVKIPYNYFKTKNLTFLLLLLISISAFSQEKYKTLVSNFIKSSQIQKSQQKELFFLHTNKDIYLTNEKIWFKAYVGLESNNKPSYETTNLHINLYNSSKQLVSSNLFLVNNGTAYGEIFLKDILESGIYYIELETFKSQKLNKTSYLKTIKIINPSENLQEINAADESLDIQQAFTKSLELNFFVHNNLLIENVTNIVTIRARYNGMPKVINGDIIDNTSGIIVAKFQSDENGFGQFNLMSKKNRNYTALITINGAVKEFKLPNSTQIGFSVDHNDDTTNKELYIYIETNNETIQSVNNGILFVVLHKGDAIQRVFPLKLINNQLKYRLLVPSNLLNRGVYSITLFNRKNTPIHEYSFFLDLKEKKIELSILKKEGDSLSLKLIANQFKGVANLSISVLPATTRLLNENQSNIFQDFLLYPIKYKLNNTSINSKYLNFILQTTSISSSINNSYKKEIITVERGLNIRGNISSKIKNTDGFSVLLMSQKSNLLVVKQLNKNKTFEFNNIILAKPGNYSLALLNRKGEVINTTFNINEKMLSYKPNGLKTSDFNNFNKLNLIYDDEVNNLSLGSINNLLDEVKIKNVRKKEDLEMENFPSHIMHSPYGRTIKVTKLDYHLRIYDYIGMLPGISVSGNPNGDFQIFNRANGGFGNSGSANIIEDEGEIEGGGGLKISNTGMGVYIDEIYQQSTSYLSTFTTSDILAVYVNKSGLSDGIRGGSGTIRFYTNFGKYGPGVKMEQNSNHELKHSETQFNIPTPKYKKDILNFTNSQSKEFYDTLDWIPNYYINSISKKPHTLKINYENIKDIKLIINGFTTNGDLIYDIIDLYID